MTDKLQDIAWISLTAASALVLGIFAWLAFRYHLSSILVHLCAYGSGFFTSAAILTLIAKIEWWHRYD